MSTIVSPTSEGTSVRGPELFIALVAAAGTEVEYVSKFLRESLESVSYLTEPIRLADLIRSIPAYEKLATSPADTYILGHQKAGDEIREKTNDGAALAILAIADIRNRRLRISKEKDGVLPSRAYLFRSLKNPKEAEALRDLYGEAFFLIGVYAPHETRKNYLARRIAETHHDFHIEKYISKAEEIIQKDQEEIGRILGQNVRGTFHKADVFVDASDPESLKRSMQRFVELVFGNTFQTPTRDEYGMYHAQAAALRSAELGRQVGAVIASDEGDIIAVGTNEVPKAGGGLYWSGDDIDKREFRLGEDSNDRHKRDLLADLLKRLQEQGWLAPDKASSNIETLIDLALDDERSPFIAGAQMMD